jgi:hypothetical protein
MITGVSYIVSHHTDPSLDHKTYRDMMGRLYVDDTQKSFLDLTGTYAARCGQPEDRGVGKRWQNSKRATEYWQRNGSVPPPSRAPI